ncbi:MAG: hypothetical protein ABSC91_02665 [Candidatus Bathyarchaeia archaeon]
MRSLALALCLFLSFLTVSAQASTYHFYTPLTECKVSASDILLDEGPNATAYVASLNRTWIEVNATGTPAESYYEYLINITNLSTNMNYTVKLENENINGLSRLANFTAYFHDDSTSKQIEVSNGSLIQSSGPWYSLPSSATIYVSTAIKVSTSESSTVDLGLHIVAGGTTSPEIIQTVTINVD